MGDAGFECSIVTFEMFLRACTCLLVGKRNNVSLSNTDSDIDILNLGTKMVDNDSVLLTKGLLSGEKV